MRRVGESLALAACLIATTTAALAAPGTQDGRWQYLGGDSAHTRYSPAGQIDASNFNDLEEAWVWDGARNGFGRAVL